MARDGRAATRAIPRPRTRAARPGESERHPADVSRGAYVEDAAAAIERLNLAPVVLVGQSLGGHTAFLVAARHPELVRALVVVEASAGGPDRAAPGRVREMLAGWPVPFPSLAAARAFFGGETLAARVIDVPTLVTSGRYDECTPRLAEQVHDGIHGSEWVVFEESSHTAFIEEREHYTQILDDFLTRVESPAPTCAGWAVSDDGSGEN